MTGLRTFDAVKDNAFPLADLHKLCFPDPWDAQAIARLSGGPGFALLHGTLARLNGFVIARAVAGEAEILTIATHPQRRRTGIGRALMRGAAAEARARGAATMFLEVGAANIPAVALYSSLGFAKAGDRKGYYRVPGSPPSDAWIMRADLPLTPPAD